MNSGIIIAIIFTPLAASALEACSSKQDLPIRHGASLIQTRGTVMNTQRPAGENPELSAFDQDYLTDANNPLDVYYAGQRDSQSTNAASASQPADSTPAPTVPVSQPAGRARQRALEGTGLPNTMDAWERDLLVNGKTSDSDEAARLAPSSFNSGSLPVQSATEACVTREDPQAKHIAYTTAAAGTPCVFGVDERDEGSHCIMSGGAYGTLGWCFTSAAKDTFGSCSSSCPLFGPAKLLGDKINSLDATVREHQAWERWMATSTTSTTSAATTTASTTSLSATTAATAAAAGTVTQQSAAKTTAGSSQTSAGQENTTRSVTAGNATATATANANAIPQGNAPTTSLLTTADPLDSQATGDLSEADGDAFAQANALSADATTVGSLSETDGNTFAAANALSADSKADGELSEVDGDAFAKANALSADITASGDLSDADGDAFAQANALSADSNTDK